MLKFPSAEWVQTLQTQLNQSAEYRAAAATWEGDIAFVVQADAALPEPVTLYLDLWHGECRAACIVGDDISPPPAFTIAGPLATWRKVLEKKLDPIMALMTRQLQLTGPMAKIMKNPKAATALVDCATQVETEWPG